MFLKLPILPKIIPSHECSVNVFCGKSIQPARWAKEVYLPANSHYLKGQVRNGTLSDVLRLKPASSFLSTLLVSYLHFNKCESGSCVNTAKCGCVHVFSASEPGAINQSARNSGIYFLNWSCIRPRGCCPLTVSWYWVQNFNTSSETK